MGGRNTSSGRRPPPTPLPPPMPKPPPQPKPQPKPKPKPQPKPAPTTTTLELHKMDDATLASFVRKAKIGTMPHGYHDDITQRMILSAKWNDKPEVLPFSQVEAAAKKRGAVVMYRTVNNNTALKTTASEIADDFRTGNSFNTGGHGGQAYGGGAYFSSSLSGSKGYGYKSYKNQPNTIGAVLNSKAKVVSMTDLYGPMGQSWIKKHPAAARQLGFYKDGMGRLRSKHSMGSYTALAMAMGYNVVSNKVTTRETYYTVLDRSALTTSAKDYYPQRRGMK